MLIIHTVSLCYTHGHEVESWLVCLFPFWRRDKIKIWRQRGRSRSWDGFLLSATGLIVARRCEAGRGVMGAGAQNEWVAIRACLLSTLIHLTFHPGYSFTVASLEKKKEKKSIQTYLYCPHRSRNILRLGLSQEMRSCCRFGSSKK